MRTLLLGKIYTVAEPAWAEAILIENGKIAAVFTERENALKQSCPDTQILDCGMCYARLS
jgi:predicted amidohydrolase YtcJ